MSTSENGPAIHRSVLPDEVVSLMKVRPGGVYVDGTLGNAGHARRILELAGPAGFLIGLDRDLEALGRAEKVLSATGLRFRLVHANYAEMAVQVRRLGLDSVDGVLLDLGVSTEQLTDPRRGFSLQADGELDMRMDPTDGAPASEIVNRWSEEDLADVIYRLGEEPASRRIARELVKARAGGRRIAGTLELARLVEQAVGGRRGRIHPATRTFQALRMAVNDELGALDRGLAAALDLLTEGGRLAVISFHSLEDRAVKKCFQRHEGRWECLPEGGQTLHVEEPVVRIVTRKPVVPSEAEQQTNPRSRSAKLRVVERLSAAA
jgi:16S rRNA (cytosine1402-N4)-methyltransferase